MRNESTYQRRKRVRESIAYSNSVIKKTPKSRLIVKRTVWVILQTRALQYNVIKATEVRYAGYFTPQYYRWHTKKQLPIHVYNGPRTYNSYREAVKDMNYRIDSDIERLQKEIKTLKSFKVGR